MSAKPSDVSNPQETLILVDEQDNETGSCAKVECHLGDGKLHRAFSVFLFNPEGKLLLQQRSESKMLWPLYWANSCCSHPRLGEETEDAARRRMREELGVQCEIRFLYKFVYHASYGTAGSEHENCWVFAGHFDGKLDINENEIADVKFLSPDELTRAIEDNGEHYSPWLKLEWERIRKDFLDQIT